MPLIADTVRSLYASVIVAAGLIAALVLGRSLLIPLAIASILAFGLNPVVSRLVNLRVPHALAVSTIVGILVVAAMGLATLIGAQLVSLAGELGTYRFNIMEKVRTVAGAAHSDSALKRASDTLGSLEREFKAEFGGPAITTPAATATPSPPNETREQMQVHVTDGEGDALQTVTSVLGPAGSVALTLLFTLFMLLQRYDLRDRLVRIAGTDNLSGTTAAISDAAERLGRLLLAQTMVNAGFAIAVGAALWLIGLPNVLLWAVLAFFMRFVPYVGSILAALPPVLLAAAVDPGWSMVLATLAIYAMGEPLVGHIIEPLVLGPRAGLSPFAMLASASFWATIWGPIGLILAAPLSLALVILGRYVKGLEFLTVLLGDEPPLTPAQQLYHRLLANDPLAASMEIEAHSEDKTFAEIADRVVMPALELAALDYDSGRLDRERAEHLRENLADILPVAEIERLDPKPAAESGARLANALIVPARSLPDIAAAELIARSIEGRRVLKPTLSGEATGLTAIAQAASEGGEPIGVVVIVSSGGEGSQYLPLIARRARQRFPDAALYLLDPSGSEAPPRLERQPEDARAVWSPTFGSLLDHIGLSAPDVSRPMRAQPAA